MFATSRLISCQTSVAARVRQREQEGHQYRPVWCWFGVIPMSDSSCDGKGVCVLATSDSIVCIYWKGGRLVTAGQVLGHFLPFGPVWSCSSGGRLRTSSEPQTCFFVVVRFFRILQKSTRYRYQLHLLFVPAAAVRYTIMR